MLEHRRFIAVLKRIGYCIEQERHNKAAYILLGGFAWGDFQHMLTKHNACFEGWGDLHDILKRAANP